MIRGDATGLTVDQTDPCFVNRNSAFKTSKRVAYAPNQGTLLIVAPIRFLILAGKALAFYTAIVQYDALHTFFVHKLHRPNSQLKGA